MDKHSHLSSVEIFPSTMLVYLQGILVYGTLQRSSNPVIVHLDSTRFVARMPDRNCLIDASAKIQEIEQSVGALVHAKLVQKQKELSHEEFASRYWATALKFAPDVLRDHPVVPSNLFVKLLGLQCWAYWFESSEIPHDLGLVARAAFERGDLKIVRGGDSVYLPDDPLSAVKRAYVMAHGGLVLPGNMLPDGHWLLNAPHLDLDDFEVDYKILNEGGVAGSDLLSLQFSIRLCEAIEIEGPWGAVVIDDTEIAIGVDAVNGVVSTACLYVPTKTTELGGGVFQFESFSSEDDRHDETAQDEAIRRYRRWISQARNTSPVALLNDLLSTVSVDVVTVRGARFILEVSEKGDLKVVEQVDVAKD